MSERSPIQCIWDGRAFTPVSDYWIRRAAKDYGEGEVIRMVELPDRSSASHNHFFASVESAWSSLPPLMAERFPSAEHLRKYALIKAGYCYSDSITCPSHADAMRVMAFAKARDEFSLVTVNKNVVTRYTAKSQNFRAMGKIEFQASKDGVLQVIADMLEVSKSELSSAGEAA